MSKPILCLDFDGVLNSYTSGWVTATFIPDPPTPGAMNFLFDALKHFDVKIYSSRSNQEGGIEAMATWIGYWAKKTFVFGEQYSAVMNAIVNNRDAFPKEKPPALVTIDDRAITFTGEWPAMETLLAFKPWNKK